MTAIPDTSDVIALAKSLGAGRRLVGGEWLFSDDQLVAFHDAIIGIAMERAAKLADQEAEHLRQFVPGYGSEKYEIQAEALDDFAFEIRKAKRAEKLNAPRGIVTMSEHLDESANQFGPPGSKGCACKAAGARLCYVIRYDVDPADDEMDDGSCECACHSWINGDDDE